jgi:hypothetical protein
MPDDDRFEVHLRMAHGLGEKAITVRSYADAEAYARNWEMAYPGSRATIYRISSDEVAARAEWRDHPAPASREAMIRAIPIGDPPSLAEMPWDRLPVNVRRALGDRHRSAREAAERTRGE